MKDTQHIASLLQKYMEDTLTEAELRALRDWAASHPAYQAYWERVQDDEFMGDSLRALAELQDTVGKPWPQRLEATVLERIEVPGERRSWERRSWRARVARALPYAAAILAILSIGIYWYSNSTTPPSPQLTSQYGGDALPGTNRATLTLADGRTIDLSESQQGIVVADEISYSDGTQVVDAGKESLTSDVSRLMSLTTPRGGTYQVTLPDGSKVWLNAASTLTYPSRFDGESRAVILEGEAYFDIVEMQGTGGTRVPFKVSTSGQTVEVLGTQFNISAYADEAETRTTLVEGRVKVMAGAVDVEPVPTRREANKYSPDNMVVVLTPLQQSIARGARLEVHTVDPAPFIAWKNNEFRFENTPLENVLRQVARWYDMEVDYTSLPAERINGNIQRDKKLSSVLYAVERVSGVKFNITGRRITIVDR